MRKSFRAQSSNLVTNTLTHTVQLKRENVNKCLLILSSVKKWILLKIQVIIYLWGHKKVYKSLFVIGDKLISSKRSRVLVFSSTSGSASDGLKDCSEEIENTCDNYIIQLNCQWRIRNQTWLSSNSCQFSMDYQLWGR